MITYGNHLIQSFLIHLLLDYYINHQENIHLILLPTYHIDINYILYQKIHYPGNHLNHIYGTLTNTTLTNNLATNSTNSNNFIQNLQNFYKLYKILK